MQMTASDHIRASPPTEPAPPRPFMAWYTGLLWLGASTVSVLLGVKRAAWRNTDAPDGMAFVAGTIVGAILVTVIVGAVAGFMAYFACRRSRRAFNVGASVVLVLMMASSLVVWLRETREVSDLSRLEAENSELSSMIGRGADADAVRREAAALRRSAPAGADKSAAKVEAVRILTDGLRDDSLSVLAARQKFEALGGLEMAHVSSRDDLAQRIQALREWSSGLQSLLKEMWAAPTKLETLLIDRGVSSNSAKTIRAGFESSFKQKFQDEVLRANLAYVDAASEHLRLLSYQWGWTYNERTNEIFFAEATSADTLQAFKENAEKLRLTAEEMDRMNALNASLAQPESAPSKDFPSKPTQTPDSVR